MHSRRPSRTLIAAAILAACLAVTGLCHAQPARSQAATACQSGSLSPRKLLACAQRIFSAESACGARSLLHWPLPPVIADLIEPVPASAAAPLPPAEPGLYRNQSWMRTSRAWAS